MRTGASRDRNFSNCYQSSYDHPPAHVEQPTGVLTHSCLLPAQQCLLACPEDDASRPTEAIKILRARYARDLTAATDRPLFAAASIIVISP
jgi:hypothetical protein